MDFIALGTWLWQDIGKDFLSTVGRQAKRDWEQFRWLEAAKNYHARMRELYSEMRVLGKPDPVLVDGIFTDAYVLDRLTAHHRFNIDELKKDQFEPRFFNATPRRLNALDLAKQKDRLFILGKPGAGKTTFLKYLTLQALDNKFPGVPIFISLHEWAKSGLELMPFIIKQFEICNFPDASAFINYLLKNNLTVTLFDGLDEVNEENDQRYKLTLVVNNFAKMNRNNKIFITCRIAASNYLFDGFTDVEVADFDENQVEAFVQKWFRNEPDIIKRFTEELQREQNHGLKELAKTPILLALLCLAFRETLFFPPRRDEIYDEALNALLTKWDKSRGITRDEFYKALTPGRRRQMFARLAAEYFEKGEIFFRADDLANRIQAWVANLPSEEIVAPDGMVILKAIEAQHGIFVERAQGIYSFSHLTLQEYFTARYVVDNSAAGTIVSLVNSHISDRRWREVFLLTASMLSDAQSFFQSMRREVDHLIIDDSKLVELINWASSKSQDYFQVGHPAIGKALARTILEIISYFGRRETITILDSGIEHDVIADPTLLLDIIGALLNRLAYALSLGHMFSTPIDLALDIVLDRALFRMYVELIEVGNVYDYTLIQNFARTIQSVARFNNVRRSSDSGKAIRSLKLPKENSRIDKWVAYTEQLRHIMVQHRNIKLNWDLTTEQLECLADYDYATVLLAECLRVAAVSNRKEIEESLFLPPKVD